ncbi:hypothetical protein ACNKGP_13940 [Acinetobacter baumannii]
MLKDYLGLPLNISTKQNKPLKKRDLMMLGVILMSEKINYFQHAKQCNFTEKQTLGLDAVVHITMGNLLDKRR